ncbi:Syntaxin [Arachis hypogaea]|nr:Syntaxin [Arachis hypogaea]
MNDLLASKSFVSRNGSPDDHVIEINPGAAGATLDQFFADVEATKDEMKNLENIFQSLKSLNEESKTLYDATAVKDLCFLKGNCVLFPTSGIRASVRWDLFLCDTVRVQFGKVLAKERFWLRKNLYTVATMSGYSSAVKLEIEILMEESILACGKYKQEVSSWYYRTAMDKDELWQSGPQLHTGIARFRSVPRRNSWSGLIPSEYTFMVEYDSSLNYDCRCFLKGNCVLFPTSGIRASVRWDLFLCDTVRVQFGKVLAKERFWLRKTWYLRYSSAVKLEIENFDGRINFGLWQVQVKDVLIQSDKKYPHGITALPWIRMSCGNQVHNCTRALVGVEMQARFRSVPRRNSWSGLIPSEYTFMVEYDSSLNYDCRYRQWQQRIVDICFERVWVYWGAGERKKSMCCNNFHIVIFSGCHLTTAVVFSPDLRSRMDADVALALKKAKFIKLKLETLESSNASSRRVPTCGPGSSSDRTRMSVVHGLKMKLKNFMDAFNGLRNQISAEYRDTVQRRYFTITGEKPDEKTVEILISTGESESLVQKAIEEHGRGRIVETLKEIEERHDAVKEIERRLMELQQVFLDMAVLVQSQGERLNDIESFVTKANSFVESGTRQVEVAVKTQKSTRKWTCCAIILIILIIFLLLFLLKPWQPNKGAQLTHVAPKTL